MCMTCLWTGIIGVFVGGIVVSLTTYCFIAWQYFRLLEALQPTLP